MRTFITEVLILSRIMIVGTECCAFFLAKSPADVGIGPQYRPLGL
jgi:hypothetical protein